MPDRSASEQIAGSIHLLVQQTRLSDGTRKITAISEITGIDDDQKAREAFERHLTPLVRPDPDMNRRILDK